MGESRDARIGLLQQLATLNPHPESVPINMLVAVEGTPLASRTPEDPLDVVRMIATARVLMPRSYVRLSAGRLSLSDEAQALCFLAGANSVFLGDRLLTTPNPTADVDRSLFERLGLRLQVRADAVGDVERLPSTVATLGS
jgi:biotin synthase